MRQSWRGSRGPSYRWPRMCISASPSVEFSTSNHSSGYARVEGTNLHEGGSEDGKNLVIDQRCREHLGELLDGRLCSKDVGVVLLMKSQRRRASAGSLTRSDIVNSPPNLSHQFQLEVSSDPPTQAPSLLLRRSARRQGTSRQGLGG